MQLARRVSLPSLKASSVSSSRRTIVAHATSERRFDAALASALVSVALMGSAIQPEFLMPQAEAARSSGRAGSSSGFSARKSAPMKSQAAPA